MTASLQETQAPMNGSGNFFAASAGRPQSREKSSATNGSSSGWQPLSQRVERTPAREPSTSASLAARRPSSELRHSNTAHSSYAGGRLSALQKQLNRAGNAISTADMREEDALASSISSASSEPRSSKKNDNIEAMADSDMEMGEVRREGPPTPDLISDNEPAETMDTMDLSMAQVIHTPYVDDTQLNFPRRKADPRGRKPEVIDTDADWEMPFPLSDGSDGCAEDMPPDAEQSEEEFTDTEQPVIEGSSHFPPWLQRAPYEMDNRFAGCNPHAARKGRPARRMRADTHNGEVQ